jgi:hypothetical protein
VAIKWVNTGELEALANGLSNDGTWNIKLFSNDHTPADDDDPSDYTEATFEGYASGQLTRDGAMYTDGTDKATQDYETITYTFTGTSGSQTIYGWYAVNDMSVLILAERFGSAKTFDPGHPELELQISLQAYSAN